MLKHKSEFAGICPACGLAVYQSEPDGPVWTCPYDLNTKNPYYVPVPDDFRLTPAQKKKLGVDNDCPEWQGEHCPSDDFGGTGHMPLHSACYGKGDY